MAKRLMVLMGMLAAMLVLAVLVLAQDEQYTSPPEETITVTGTIEDLGPNVEDTPAYGIADDAMIAAFVLEGERALLASEYVGERLTVEGLPRTGEDGLVFLEVISFAPVEPPSPGGQEVEATGVLRDGLPEDVGGFGTHSISDDATGELYALRSAGADLDFYVSQRVTVYGALTPGEEGSGEGGFEGGGTLPSIDVTRVEPAGGPIEDEEIGVTFELAVEGEVPEGTQIFGGASQQTVGLEDPDGDGTYKGVLTLAADFAEFPVPVAILAGSPEVPNQQTIKYFGDVMLEDGDVFSASYSFGGPPPGPVPGSLATITYELAVECEPPADATLLGFTSAESLATTPLNDRDGDGIYTGSIDVPKFAPGPVRPDTEPVSLPFRIVQGPATGFSALGPEYRVIKDFGLVLLDGDKTLLASISFCDGGGSEGTGDGAPRVSGDTNDDKGDGSVSVDVDSSGSEQGVVSSTKLLPATGGVLTIAGLAGLALVAGGLVVRKIIR